ncbi:ExeA family protein [Schlesneria paludicola]|uniref:ExeA family protein n=1 Tax=Schlesneria paludicola TaxID=360056 RepID=UPI00029A51C3|nr:AAA family ATPase [Schlesneria paludicola]
MYEASFGLKRRPFAATPDASCFLSAGPIQGALDELVVCVEQGQGIAVLTAPAGTGKTLLCERLRSELDERYETVFLRHASFLTRRALLQTVLCELNHAYHHPSEQELRLELFPAIRALQPKREALVLICDEAHQLTDSLLEELRILADFAEHGRPLVRLVLVGQLSLEEKLAQPSMEAINQRIRAHVSVSPFDHAGSLDYIDYRLTWAGGRTEEVFTPEALDLIARASDGIPRCINQLADHSLLLAFVAEQHPAEADLVREALNDLRQLPLHWNEVPQSLGSADHVERIDHSSEFQPAPYSISRESTGYLADSTSNPMTYSYEPEFNGSSTSETHEHETPVPRPVPEALEILESLAAHEISSVEVGSEDWRQTIEAFTPRTTDMDLDDMLAELASSEPDGEIDEEFEAKLSRRLQFHDLLQDAYEAAAEAKMKSSSADIDSVVEFVESVDHSPISQSEQTREVAHASIGQTPAAPVNIAPPTSSFQEEMIVDRYASIDAGFAPPPVSFPDTPSLADVRTEPVFSKEVSQFERPAAEPVNQLHLAEESSTAITGAEEVDAEPQFVDHEFAAEAADIESSFELAEAAMVDSEPAAPIATYETPVAYPAMGRRDTLSADVNEVASEVYSLGQSLRPTGVLSANSAAILHSLGYEIGEVVIPGQKVNPPVAEITPEPVWESTETPAVAPPATEQRPLRFLFSMLRRKQQGLS